MKKGLVTLLFMASIAASASISASAVSGSYDNFKASYTYTCGQFSDVDNAQWFSMYVQGAYEYGLFSGKSSATFAPEDKLTKAEAIKLADSLNCIYFGDQTTFTTGTSWYQPYVNFALKKGIISQSSSNYNTYITRAEFVQMLANALPIDTMAEINAVSSNDIPDVTLSDNFGAAVYKLFRAGILSGCDSFGTFRPNSPISRAEAAAIIARVSNPEFRKTIQFSAVLQGEEIYTKCSSAVFYLERFDSEGALIGIGSGFFITRDGLAITNYHVIGGASSAIITTQDGTQYDVAGICGYDKDADIAILQIDGSGFDYLAVDDSDALSPGESIYAIGSPFGLINTISNGNVSSINREVNGTDFIQFSAPISMGSGGGPVLNTSGHVVGISCLTVLNGQTLNFAVPINKAAALSHADSVPLISIISKNSSSTNYYKNYFPVPDYGIFVGTALYKSQLDTATGVKTYFYSERDITVSDDIAVDGYISLLAQNGFEWQSSYNNDSGSTVDVYYNAGFDISVHFGTDIVDGITCKLVAIY